MPATATVLDHVRDLLPSFHDRAAEGARAVRPGVGQRASTRPASSGCHNNTAVRRAGGRPA